MILSGKQVFLLIIMITMECIIVAQSQVTGTVKDASTQDVLAGVNIIVDGSSEGTFTNNNGKYSLTVNQTPPFTIAFSYIGFRTEKVEVTSNFVNIDMALSQEAIIGHGIVVSASRIQENIMKLRKI